MIFFPFLILGIIFWATVFFLLPFLSTASKQHCIAGFAKTLLKVSGVKIEVCGPVEAFDGKLIIAANHASFLDTFILLAVLPFPFHMTVHAIGFRVPFLRRIYKSAGYIGVGKGVETGHGLYHVLLKGGKLVIFSQPASFDFSPHLIQLSSLTDTLILPIAIKNTSKVLPFDKFRLQSRDTIKVAIGTPHKFSSAGELKQAVLSLPSPL